MEANYSELEHLRIMNAELLHDNQELKKTKGQVSASLIDRLIQENGRLSQYSTALQKEVNFLRISLKDTTAEFENRLADLMNKNKRLFEELDAKSADLKGITTRIEKINRLNSQSALQLVHNTETQIKLQEQNSLLKKENRELRRKIDELQTLFEDKQGKKFKIRNFEMKSSSLESEKKIPAKPISEEADHSQDLSKKPAETHDETTRHESESGSKDQRIDSIDFSMADKNLSGLFTPNKGESTIFGFNRDSSARMDTASQSRNSMPASLDQIKGEEDQTRLKEGAVDSLQELLEKIGRKDTEITAKTQEINNLENLKSKYLNEIQELKTEYDRSKVNFEENMKAKEAEIRGLELKAENFRKENQKMHEDHYVELQAVQKRIEEFITIVEEKNKEIRDLQSQIDALTKDKLAREGKHQEVQTHQDGLTYEELYDKSNALEEALQSKDKELQLWEVQMEEVSENFKIEISQKEEEFADKEAKLKQKCEQFEEKLGSKEEELKTLKAQVEKLKKSEFQSEKLELQTGDCGHAAELNELRSQINQLNSQIIDKEEEFERLKQELEEEKSKIKEDEVTLKSQKASELDALRNDNELLQTEIERLNRIINEREEKKKERQEAKLSAMREQASQVERLQNECQSMTESIKERESHLEQLESQIRKLKNENENIERDLVSKQNQLANAERVIDTLKGELEHIKTKEKDELNVLMDQNKLQEDLVEKQHAEILKLKEEIQALERDKSIKRETLVNEEQDLKNQVARLEDKVQVLQDELNQMEKLKEILSLKDEEINQFKDCIGSKDREIEELKKQVQAEIHKCKASEQKISNLKKELANNRNLPDKLRDAHLERDELLKKLENSEKKIEKKLQIIREKEAEIEDLREKAEQTNNLLNELEQIRAKLAESNCELEKLKQMKPAELAEKYSALLLSNKQLEEQIESFKGKASETDLQETTQSLRKQLLYAKRLRDGFGITTLLFGVVLIGLAMAITGVSVNRFK